MNGMSRRELIKAFGIGGGIMLGAQNALGGGAPARKEGQMPTIRVKARFYRHHPVDYDSPAPATGFLGWAEEDLEVDLSQSVLLCMHLWNVGLEGGPDWGPNAPWQGWARMAEWAPRCRELILDRLPPILEAARKGGLRLGHVASGAYADKYPQYKRIREKYGAGPEAKRGSIKTDWRAEHDAEVFGADFARDVAGAYKNLDFPVNTRPEGDEPVFVHTEQLNGYLREHGIWNLIYVGFAINWCLWFSPCGMWDMTRLGYRCSCIQEGVTTVENADSAPTMRNLDEAFWRTSLMFGYVLPAGPLVRALKA